MNPMLTAEQVQAISSAKEETIRLRHPGNNQEYVLIKAEVYERLRGLLADDTVYTTAEMLDQVMADDDAHDPQLAALQKKYGGVSR